MDDILDSIYRLLLHPVGALQDVTREGKIKTGFVIWLFVLALITLSTVQFDGGWPVAFLLMVVFSAISILIHSAIIDYLSGFLGGRGTAKGITAGFLAAYFPYAFVVFFLLLKQLGWEVVSGTLTCMVSLWSFALEVVAIRENYHFTTGKAFLIAVAPTLLVVGLLAVLVFVAIMAAFWGMSDVMPLWGNMMDTSL